MCGVGRRDPALDVVIVLHGLVASSSSVVRFGRFSNLGMCSTPDLVVKLAW
jgi:hypothetical protein